jgi:hydroxymethylbilane synthase
MDTLLRIGTRESRLALFQAEKVKTLLAEKGTDCVLYPVKSEGDINLTVPLYELGVQGIFTKTLDIALLNGDIDIAVHSLKDVPTALAKGLCIAAVLTRDAVEDVLVLHPSKTEADLKKTGAVIATSSLRRKAQWLKRYPQHTIESLRGNVITRLAKIEVHSWHGAIFAKAGLERINVLPANHIQLDWMIPAPAQGAIAVVCREADTSIRETLALINNANTALCTTIERNFMRALHAGCTAPVGAIARIAGNSLSLKVNVCSTDGQQCVELELDFEPHQYGTAGESAANSILGLGADKILESLRANS